MSLHSCQSKFQFIRLCSTLQSEIAAAVEYLALGSLYHTTATLYYFLVQRCTIEFMTSSSICLSTCVSCAFAVFCLLKHCSCSTGHASTIPHGANTVCCRSASAVDFVGRVADVNSRVNLVSYTV